MSEALIADIQRSSVHDGAGIRTTVFFKGCPLRCAWCHNPECISFAPQELFYPEKCIGCGQCAKGCYAGARVVCGKEISPQALLEELLRDRFYYGKIGGVTFSGGEPMAQKGFLSEMLPLCRQNGLNCAIETSLCIFDEKIFRQMDLIMADLKIWNNKLHEQYTGRGNKVIKRNFIRLNAIGVPIVARTPVIPSVNQEIDKISEFLYGLNHVVRYELLPYHPLGNTKRAALGQTPDGFDAPTAEYMKEMKRYAFIR